MIRFERYQHINDLFQHYLNETGNEAVASLLKSGVKRKRGQIYFLTKKGEIYAKAGEIDCAGTAAPHSVART